MDYTILKFIQDNLHSEFGDFIMAFITTLGNGGFIWVLISIILMISKKYKYVGVLAILALMLSTALGEGILKHLIERTRPFITHPDLHPIIKLPGSTSFPSGHTGSSFAVATVIASEIKKSKIYVYTLALLIGLSRLYVLVHYPTDVLGGIVLGIFSGYITIILCKKLFRPPSS